jgi:hypothetical protein
MTLKSVVLPAPFGPMSEWMPRSGTLSDTGVHGFHAAENLADVADLQERPGHHALLRARAASSVGKMPCGRKNHGDGQDEPEGDHLQLAGPAQKLWQHREQSGAEHDAVGRAAAADDHHRGELDRAQKGAHVGGDEAGIMGRERACDPGEQARDREGPDLHCGRVDAGNLGRNL